MCKHVCGGSICVWITFKWRWQIALYYEGFGIIDCTSHRKEYDHADMINDLFPSAIMMYSLDVWSFKCSHISLYICLQSVKLLKILKNVRISMNLESSVASLKSMIMSAETRNRLVLVVWTPDALKFVADHQDQEKSSLFWQSWQYHHKIIHNNKSEKETHMHTQPFPHFLGHAWVRGRG